MQRILLPIDTKSLFLNIFNDNESGHTATVSTPIKQGNSTNERLMQIFKMEDLHHPLAYAYFVVN